MSRPTWGSDRSGLEMTASPPEWRSSDRELLLGLDRKVWWAAGERFIRMTSWLSWEDVRSLHHWLGERLLEHQNERTANR